MTRKTCKSTIDHEKIATLRCPMCGARATEWRANPDAKGNAPVVSIQCGRPGAPCLATGGNNIGLAIRRWQKIADALRRAK